MQIEFRAGDKTLRFRRNWFTGRALLESGRRSIPLGSPYNPLTHVSFSLSKAWKVSLDGQTIVIEKRRPLLLAGFRPHRYRILVDDQEVAAAHGY